MAFRALAFAWSLVLASAVTTPAFAEDREPPRIGAVVVPGIGGRLLALSVAVLHRPPGLQADRPPTWSAPPAGLPRPTIATVWKITF